MYRHIMRIGNAKYKFERKALAAFIEEARANWSGEQRPEGVGGTAAAAPSSGDERLARTFDEVMGLYRAYMASESVDALVRLKNRLEEISLAYRSHVLAAEVLSINSCLPYERRVPALKC